MSGISNELREFLKGWLKWVEDGAPDSRDFNRRHGLCVQPSLALDDYWELCSLLYDEFAVSFPGRRRQRARRSLLGFCQQDRGA